MGARETHVKVSGSYIGVIEPHIKQNGAYRSDCFRLWKKISGSYQIIWERKPIWGSYVHVLPTWGGNYQILQNVIPGKLPVTWKILDRSTLAVISSGSCTMGSPQTDGQGTVRYAASGYQLCMTPFLTWVSNAYFRTYCGEYSIGSQISTYT